MPRFEHSSNGANTCARITGLAPQPAQRASSGKLSAAWYSLGVRRPPSNFLRCSTRELRFRFAIEQLYLFPTPSIVPAERPVVKKQVDAGGLALLSVVDGVKHAWKLVGAEVQHLLEARLGQLSMPLPPGQV